LGGITAKGEDFYETIPKPESKPDPKATPAPGYFQPDTGKATPDDGKFKQGGGEGKKEPGAGQTYSKGDAKDLKTKTEGGEQKPAEKAAKYQPPAKDPAPQATRRIVIRSGDMEFEVNSFDAAVATVTKLVTAIPGAFVATVNSEKLPNGKVKGSITVRTPPDHLDALVLDLRKELGQQGE
jgi:hypothetical protein